MADATPGEQSERVADWASAVLKSLERVAAQGDVLSQDDPPGRSLSVLAETQHRAAEGNSAAPATPRPGLDTPGLSVQVGAQRLCLYEAGGRQAGENLAGLWTRREPQRDKPLVRLPRWPATALGQNASFAVRVWRTGGASAARGQPAVPGKARW